MSCQDVFLQISLRGKPLLAKSADKLLQLLMDRLNVSVQVAALREPLRAQVAGVVLQLQMNLLENDGTILKLKFTKFKRILS